MNDSAMTDTTIRLTKIDMDGQVYYSQFAFNLMLDKQKELEAENKKLREAIKDIVEKFETTSYVSGFFYEWNKKVEALKEVEEK